MEIYYPSVYMNRPRENIKNLAHVARGQAEILTWNFTLQFSTLLLEWTYHT